MPYRIEADRSETWIWTDHEVIVANDEDKTYEVTVLPPTPSTNRRNKPSNWLHPNVHFYAPFVFDIDAERLRLEWSLTLQKQLGEAAMIEATPRTAELKSRYSRCIVRLNTRDWHPTAVKYVDHTGDLETVYVVQSWQPNPNSSARRNFGKDFTDFRASSYKQIGTPWQRESRTNDKDRE